MAGEGSCTPITATMVSRAPRSLCLITVLECSMGRVTGNVMAVVGEFLEG